MTYITPTHPILLTDTSTVNQSNIKVTSLDLNLTNRRNISKSYESFIHN